MCAGVLLFVDSFAANFSTDIAPILQRECLTCHSAEKAKGGYRVHTFAAVLQPGKSREAAVVPEKPEESELFKRLATHDPDDRMPQDDDPLSALQIELFRQWISEGAKLDRGEPNSPLALLIPRAPHPVPPEFYRAPLPVTALAFTPDGRQLATSGYHEILFWSLEGELQARVTNAPQRVHSIAFKRESTDTNIFVVAGGKPGRSGEVSIYENAALLTNLVLTADEMLTVAFSPDGKLLAAGGADNSIRVFRTDTWESVTTILQHADWVTSVLFNAAGDKIISGSRDRTARIYEAESGELDITYTAHGAALFAATFVGDDLAASAGKEKEVHLWNTKEGKKQKVFGEAGGEIYALAANGDFIFAASADHKIRQYSVKDRKLLRTFSDIASAVFAVAYDAANNQLAAATYQGVVHVWDVRNGNLRRTFVAAPPRSDKSVATAAQAPAPRASGK